MLVAACGGGGGTPDPDAMAAPDATVDAMPDAPATLALMLDRTALTAPPGIGVEVDVTITRGEVGGDLIVALAGTPPAGVTAPAVTLAGDQSTATFVIWLDGTVAAGTHALSITASGGGAVAAAAFDLEVDPSAPGFVASWTSILGSDPPTLDRVIWLAPGWTSLPGMHVYAQQGYAHTPTVTSIVPATATATAEAVMLGTGSDRPVLAIGAASDAPEGDRDAAFVFSDGTLRQVLAADLWISTPGLDASIGAAGRTASDPSAPFDAAALAVDSAGRPLVIGRTSNTTSLGARRYTATGVLDTSFGAGGTATIASQAGATPVDGVIAAEDVIYVLATTNAGDAGVARLLADGGADPTWGGAGWRTFDVGHEAEIPRRMRLHEGNLYLAGRYLSSGVPRPDVICVTTGGAACAGFGTGGVAELDLPNATVNALVFDAQGRLIIAGATSDGSLLIARFTTAGAPDPTFDGDGIFTHAFSSGQTIAQGVAVDASGRIIIVGDEGTSSGSAFIARLTAAGALDPAFSTDGFDLLQLVPGGVLDSFAFTAVNVTTDAITVVGTRDDLNDKGQRVAVVRYDHTGTRVSTFGRAGADWLLGGTGEREVVFGAVAVGEQLWIGAHASLARDQHVLMKHTGS